MKEIPELRAIVSCAAIAAVCGGAVTAASYIVALSFPGSGLEMILAMVLAVLVGIILSVFTAWPLGILVGWLVARAMGVRPRSAAIAGLDTALVMIAAALGDEFLRSSFEPTDAYWTPAS